LPKSTIHDALTDVCGEICMLEAERLRLRRMLAHDRESAEEGAVFLEAKQLGERQRMVEGRLEELEARAAYLRAELERASQHACAE
jgi:hypothetical protein